LTNLINSISDNSEQSASLTTTHPQLPMKTDTEELVLQLRSLSKFLLKRSLKSSMMPRETLKHLKRFSIIKKEFLSSPLN